MDRRRLEEEQRALEARREQQLDVERLRRQSLESTEPHLEMPPTVVPESSVDARPSGLTASQERSVVDEYYVQGVQSPQASMITKTLGINTQDSQGVPTSADFMPTVTSSGRQSTPAKPSIAPMQLDTPVMPTTAQSSRLVTDTPTAASSKLIPTPDVGTTTSKPASTAATPEVPAAAASTAPIVIVRQLKEVLPRVFPMLTLPPPLRVHYINFMEIIPRTFYASRKGQSVDYQGGAGTTPCLGIDGTGS